MPTHPALTLAFLILFIVAGLMAAHYKGVADAQFECSSRGMEAYVYGDSEDALRWLGESNKAYVTGHCEDGDRRPS